jgi:AcrR family transcriptional regulator
MVRNNCSMTEQAVGLRDRKRADTRARLERAAVEIVLRDGLDHATVDAISEAADVSSRTFFNYFDSKEDAILGMREFDLSAETIAKHADAVADAGLLESLVGLMFEILGPSIGESDLKRDRMEIAQRYPQLLGRQVTVMTRMSTELVAAIGTLMARDARFEHAAGTATAEILLALCASSARAAIREWVAAGSATPVTEVQMRAISLAREVTEKLQ